MSNPSPHIVLGMPGYGKQTSAAGKGFWRACRDMAKVWNYYQAGSLLASNFNQLWCLALNLVQTGEDVRYFAMLHDDIGPEDFWLDKLIEELESKELDVLGVAVPIKDNRGITSMALHKDGDNWMPHARLSMHDIYELPETFTSEDIGHPLLLNTGCWVAKWNQEWCRTVHFEINDRIVFNRARNLYQAQTEPEDWHFSRQLHEIGAPGSPTDGMKPLRIGATRKINLMHNGEIDFTNSRPWGQWAFDKHAVQTSPVPNAFPHDVKGWLTTSEGKTLAELVRDKRVLEIGSYCGLSTICMARTAEHITAVDYFDGRGTPLPQETLTEFQDNIERYGVAHKITIQYPDEFAQNQDEYDVAFIDGHHDYEFVVADITKAMSRLKPDGMLAFHDYNHPAHPGIKDAIDGLILDGAELLSVHDTLAVVRPPAATLLETCNG